MSADSTKGTIAFPMTLTDVVKAVREILALTNDVVGKVRDVSEATQRSKGKRAAGAIDVLSFSSDGSRRHLERIAAGQGEAEDFLAIAEKMAMTGFAVERAMGRLTAYRTFIREKFGLALANEIENLIYSEGGKASIRIDLEALSVMNDPFYSREDVAREAERILANIKKLNKDIEAIHDKLLELGRNETHSS
jgi:hypothetical protein